MKYFAALLFMLMATPAQAHGVVWSTGIGATVVEYRYTTDEPMAYAAITVQGPGDTVTFQTGRTDRQGRFAFVPDHDGPWIVTADDGMGHVSTATVPIEAGRTAITSPDPFMASAIHEGWFLRTILGLSLIGNLGFATVAAQRVRRNRA
jgi:nickel transport protein